MISRAASPVSASLTTGNEPDWPQSERERRAERLGFALRGLAAELVDERRKVARLRREVEELRARLEDPADDAQWRHRRPEGGLR